MQLRQEQQRNERRRALAIWGAVAAVVLLIAGTVTTVIVRDVRSRPSLDAVAQYTVSQGHTDQPVTYDQTPPAGGEHAPQWLNCGTYESPVPNENAVHSMEHGAVWVTYRPGLPAAQLETLQKELPDTYVLLSPFQGLKNPVVVSAWGRQLPLTGANDKRLGAFVREFRLGRQAPEPGAACTGGIDGPTTPGTGP